MNRTEKIMKSPSEAIKKAQDLIEKIFREQDGEGEVIQQSALWMRATTWGLMGTATFAVTWLGIARTDEIVSVTGKLFHGFGTGNSTANRWNSFGFGRMATRWWQERFSCASTRKHLNND